MASVVTNSNGKKEGARALSRKYLKRYGKRLLRNIDRYFERQSLVPNDPVLDTSLFPWVTAFERNWDAVRSELAAVLQNRESLPFFQDISPDQMRISPDDKWRTFFLYGFGHRSERNCGLCPQTAALLEQVPGIETAFFSILAPGKIVPSHRGITKGLIRGHLGIVVPSSDPAECYMDVGDVRCTWREGKILLFDDSYPHGVGNHTDQERAVLLFDFPRPMTLRGRMVRRAVFAAFRRTAFVKDALRNEARWEQRQPASRPDEAA
jgi:ornithine lipid ester-linked acyl 2-hydroxylase